MLLFDLLSDPITIFHYNILLVPSLKICPNKEMENLDIGLQIHFDQVKTTLAQCGNFVAFFNVASCILEHFSKKISPTEHPSQRLGV